MNVILFGASGMVGQIVLRACLNDPVIEKILLVVRTPLPFTHPKIEQMIHHDFSDFSRADIYFTGYDACFFCLGVSAAGMKEETYMRITYDYTMAAAKVIATQNKQTCTFVYITGAGTDSSEKGKSMWARVKGKTENALLNLPFQAAYMFRPGIILPDRGIRSKTKLYQVFYVLTRPLFPLLKRLLPNKIITAHQLGLAFIQAAKVGAPKPILEIEDILALANQPNIPKH